MQQPEPRRDMAALDVRGSIVAMLSPESSNASSRASAIGKLQDQGAISMYYRKLEGNHLVTVLVPTTYPQTILDAASAVTAARAVCLVGGYDLDWRDGELLLLMASSSPQLRVVESPVSERVTAVLRSSGLEGFHVGSQGSCVDQVTGLSPQEAAGKGLVLVDRAFNVRGVGLVMLGFSKMGSVEVHDELVAVPSMKRVTVKSIEVLDEPVSGVGPDVRVGLALKGASLEEVEGTYMLVREPDQVINEVSGVVRRFPWADEVRQGRQYHLAYLGVVAPVTASMVNGDRVAFRATRPLPKGDRYVLIDVNVRPPRPRVIGWVERLA